MQASHYHFFAMLHMEDLCFEFANNMAPRCLAGINKQPWTVVHPGAME